MRVRQRDLGWSAAVLAIGIAWVYFGRTQDLSPEPGDIGKITSDIGAEAPRAASTPAAPEELETQRRDASTESGRDSVSPSTVNDQLPPSAETKWYAPFEEKYAQMSPKELLARERELNTIYGDGISAYARGLLEAGNYVEVDWNTPPAPGALPFGDPGTLGVFTASFPATRADGTRCTRWVSFPKDHLPEEVSSIELEVSYASILARELGLKPLPTTNFEERFEKQDEE